MLAQARTCASLSEGIAFAEKAEVLAAGSSLGCAATEHTLCYLLYRNGDIRALLARGEAALSALRAERMMEAYAEALRWLGFCACDAGDFGIAIKYATEGLALAEASGDQHQRVLALSVLAACFDRTGDPWQAERLLRDGLQIAREMNAPYPLMSTLNNLSAVLIGKFYALRDSHADDEAREAIKASLPLCREVVSLSDALNDRFVDVAMNGNLAEILVHAGEFAEAKFLLDQCLVSAEAGGFDLLALRVRCSQAELCIATGDTHAAKRTLNSLLAESRLLPELATSLRAYYGLYLAHRADGEPGAALHWLETYRRFESQRTLQQLKARSEFMVTRLEVDEAHRKGLQQAYGIAQAHASRAVALERLAHQDELTGLANRRALDIRLPELVARAQALQQPLIVVGLDLDHFKRINDKFGHSIGDRVLVQVAKLLTEHTRPGDLVTRVGGEEFVLVMPELNSTDAFTVCERLRLRVSSFQWNCIAPDLNVTFSAGIACTPTYDAVALIERADLAVYRAKRAGRNRVSVAPDMIAPAS
jgi:diguanylate cyclase (GGDEF)-like protein